MHGAGGHGRKSERPEYGICAELDANSTELAIVSVGSSRNAIAGRSACQRPQVPPIMRLRTFVIRSDVFCQHILVWSLAISYSVFSELRCETRSLSTKMFSAHVGRKVERFATCTRVWREGCSGRHGPATHGDGVHSKNFPLAGDELGRSQV
jgi:hypothetical protein